VIYSFFSRYYRCELYVPTLQERGLLEGDHEKWTLEFLNVQKGDIGIDIGACCGTFTLPTAILSGEKGLVIAVEPEPINFTCLALNVKKLNLNNVVLFNVAVSNKRGLAKLFLADLGGHHSMYEHLIDRRYAKPVGTIHVPCLTLADIVEIVNPPKIDWIKIDTEGSEKDILTEEKTVKVLEEYKPKRLSIEVHEEGHDKIIIELLESIGYEVKQSFPDSLKRHNFIFATMKQ